MELVRAYDLLPEAVVPTVGCLLPVVEVLVGVLLVLGLLTRPAAVASSLFLVVRPRSRFSLDQTSFATTR